MTIHELVELQRTALMTAGFRIPLPAQYSMRETLKYIAALYGGSFVISEQNALRLVCLWNLQSAADLTVTDTHRLRHSPAFPACTGVRFLLDDQAEAFAGDETGYVYEMTCPFATQAAANALLSRIQGFVYRPFSAEPAILDPSYELGDTVDAGEGISERDLPHIFERFYKGEKTSPDSIGIGLALSKSIIEEENGTVVVDSGPNVTTFKIKYYTL